MRRALLAVVAVLLCVPVVDAPGATVPAKAKPKHQCHWVKATKKRKRHKVCVKVKAKKPTPAKAKAPSAMAPAPTTTPSGPSPAATPSPAAPAAAPGPVAPAPVTPSPDPPDPAPTAPAAARVQATTREWSITLSRPAVAAGAVIVQLVNRGEDAHDLHLRPESGGADRFAIPAAASGAVADVTGTLPAGRYTLYCSLPGHEAAGMHATLTVQ